MRGAAYTVRGRDDRKHLDTESCLDVLRAADGTVEQRSHDEQSSGEDGTDDEEDADSHD